MDHASQDLRQQRSAGLLLQRAADELLIAAIFAPSPNEDEMLACQAYPAQALDPADPIGAPPRPADVF